MKLNIILVIYKPKINKQYNYKFKELLENFHSLFSQKIHVKNLFVRFKLKNVKWPKNGFIVIFTKMETEDTNILTVTSD